jgi:hypothetical protein
MNRNMSLVIFVFFFLSVVLFPVPCFSMAEKKVDHKTTRENTVKSKSPIIQVSLGSQTILTIKVKRLKNNPIIKPGMDARMGSNINGPSLIRVPDWVENPLGRYYLYFANHKGGYIRLAYADQPEGPWTVHEPGCLQLEESHFALKPPELHKSFVAAKERLSKPRAPNVPSQWEDLTHPHIASPDVLVIHDQKEIRMYYHGLAKTGGQTTRVAVSRDGLHFKAQEEEVIEDVYMRVFPFKGYYYAVSMPGYFYRSKDGLTDFEEGPQLFNEQMRHASLMTIDDHLLVLWTQVGDIPEHIKLSVIDMSGDDFDSLKESKSVEILRPEYSWEGAKQPLAASFRSSVNAPVNQLRDPSIFLDGDRTYLLYAIAGESGIGIAELILEISSQ